MDDKLKQRDTISTLATFGAPVFVLWRLATGGRSELIFLAVVAVVVVASTFILGWPTDDSDDATADSANHLTSDCANAQKPT